MRCQPPVGLRAFHANRCARAVLDIRFQGAQLLKMVYWLGFGLFLAMLVPLVTGGWSRQMTIELSYVGYALVVLTFLFTWIGAAAWVFHESNSSGYGQWSQLRRNSSRRWLARTVIVSSTTASLPTVIAYLYLLGLVPWLHGSSSRVRAVVAGIIDRGASSASCIHFVRLRLGDEQLTNVCMESGFKAKLRPELTSLHVGDKVDLVLKHTWLGTCIDQISNASSPQ